MAEVHNGVFNKLSGKIDSDEEFTAIIKHINKLISQGHPIIWFRDHFNRVRIKHGHTWYTYKDLMKHIPSLQFEKDENKKEYVLEEQWYKKQRSNKAEDYTWEFIYKWV